MPHTPLEQEPTQHLSVKGMTAGHERSQLVTPEMTTFASMKNLPVLAVV
jgi:hypothetical protein